MTNVYSFDNIILLPVIERDFKSIFNDYRSSLFLFASRINDAFFICEPEEYEDIRAQVDDLLRQSGLDAVYETVKCRTEKELASNVKEQYIISVAVCMATLTFSLFTFIFSMLYKIDDNIKNYAISIVVGATYGDISIRYLF